jgi:hypothetical protein
MNIKSKCLSALLSTSFNAVMPTAVINEFLPTATVVDQLLPTNANVLRRKSLSKR